MNKLRLSLIQMCCRVGSLQENLSAACALIDKAMEAAPDLILLPELFSVGPFTFERNEEWLSLAEKANGPTVSTIREKAKEYKVAIVLPFYEKNGRGLLFDTVSMIGSNGEVIGSYRKTHLATKPSLDKVYFKPGSRLVVLPYKDWHIGLIFANELLHPEAGRALSVLGAELLLVPAACVSSPLWTELYLTRAFENGCYLGVCNLSEDLKGGKPFLGGRSLLVDPLGNVVAQRPKEGQEILTETIRMDEVHRARNERFMLRDRRPDAYGLLVKQGRR